MQHFVTDVIDVRYVTKNRQSYLCPVLDFRQSVEAIGLVVEDYSASTCDCRSKGRDEGFVLHKIKANELLLQCPTLLSVTISCSWPRCLPRPLPPPGRAPRHQNLVAIRATAAGEGQTH